MSEAYVTTKIWQKTRRLLRVIAARTDESVVKLMDRLAISEYNRLENEKQDKEQSSRINLD